MNSATPGDDSSETLPTHATVLVYGFDYITQHLDILESLIPSLNKADDVEIVHDIRVAIRRTRSAIAILQPYLPNQPFRKAQKALNQLADALAGTRDNDVQLAFLDSLFEEDLPPFVLPGMRRARQLLLNQAHLTNSAFINQKIIEAQDSVSLMRTWAQQNLLTAQVMKNETNVELFSLSSTALRQRLYEFLNFETAVFHPNNEKAAHQMRISAKHLRYAMELFEQAYAGELKEGLKNIKDVQQLLGDSHDCDVWISFLNNVEKSERERIRNFFGDESGYSRIQSGILFLRHNRITERSRLFLDFSGKWANWKTQMFWTNLEHRFFHIEPVQSTSEN